MERVYKFAPVNSIITVEGYGKLMVEETLDCRCWGCVFNKKGQDCLNYQYACTSAKRKDCKSVIFKTF